MHTYVIIPKAQMREGPSDSTKVVSEALFGEVILSLKTSGSWHLIETPDGYTGWIKEGSLLCRKPYLPTVEVSRLAAHVYPNADTEFGSLLTLPFGSKLEVLDSKDSRWFTILLPDGRQGFVQKGDTDSEPFDLIAFSKKFLGLPYTWGGRSSFGFDCSGFVQMIYSRLGVQLPRDARQQVLLGTPVQRLQLGDLIFWGYSEGDIRHVGLFLENKAFIHTSVRENKPYLRISSLSDEEWSGDGYYSYRTVRRIIEKKK